LIDVTRPRFLSKDRDKIETVDPRPRLADLAETETRQNTFETDIDKTSQFC